MRRLRPFMRRGACPQRSRSRRLLQIDRDADRGGVLGRQQPRDRIRHKGGIAEQAVTVDIGVPHRLGHQMHRCRRAGARCGEMPAGQHVQHLAEDRAAGARRRRRQDRIITIRTADRRRFGDRVGGEIVGGQHAALRRRCDRDGDGDRAAVESVRPLLGNLRQDGGKIGLHEAVARPVSSAVGLQKDPRRLGILRQPVGAGGEDRGVGLAKRKTVAGQRDRRGHDRGAAERSVLHQCMVETLDGARYPDGEIAVKTALADRVASGIEKHIGGRSARRHLAKIDDAVAPVGGVDQHKAATADIAAARVDDGQRIADRDRRIDRIAAGLQDL